MAEAGGDYLQGGEGDDIIIGDVPFTDDLADDAGLTMNPGSGYLVFRALEQGESDIAGYDEWDREDTINYIIDNTEELSQESVADSVGREANSDIIDGGGGSDIIYAQEGDDTIIYDADDAVVDGGSGYDTLELQNADDIDFSLLDTGNNPLSNIEEIDLLTDAGANSLSNLSAQDVLDMTDGDDVLTILGSSNDSVSFEGGAGTWVNTIDGEFNVYTNGDAVVRIENDITDIT